MDNRKYWFMYFIRSLLGRWYIWGGDDPSGFDCSGMVVEGLKAIGAVPYDSDFTADQLWRRYKPYTVGKPTEGCLAFWFTGERATHVAVCLDEEFCITADGGGHTVLTETDAIKNNAFIKIRPITHRSNMPKFVRLF